MTIETVLLDAGRVLTYPNWDRISDILRARGLEASADALRAAEPHAILTIDSAHVVATTSDADRGTAFFHAAFDRAGVGRGEARLQALQDIYAYHQAHNIWETTAPDVFSALDALRSMGLTLAVASNANGVLQQMFDRVGLTPYFHAICDSCVEGVEKPDPRFFRIVLERAGGRPETTLHVGDLYHIDIVGARAAGIRPLLMDPFGVYPGADVDRVRSMSEVVDYVRELTEGTEGTEISNTEERRNRR